MHSFRKEINRIVIFFQFFGFIPFGHNESQDIILSSLSLLILLTIVGVFLSSIYHKTFYSNSLSSSVGSINFLSHICTHLFVVIQSFVARGKQKLLFENFTEIDRDISQVSHNKIDYGQLRRKYYISLCISVGIVVGFLIAFLIDIIVFTETDTMIFFLHSYYSSLAISMRCVQNVFYVNLLRERLQFVNDKLLEIVGKINKSDSKLILYIESHHYRYLKRNSKRNRRFDSYDEIVILKTTFGRIWETNVLINEAFGWSYLAIVTKSFIDFTSHGYWIFLACEQIIGYYFIATSMLMILPSLFLLASQCYSCQHCSQTAEDTVALVNKIGNLQHNEAFNGIVQEFALQLTHETILFTANGFFDINLDLLGSIAAATVSYLVILIQFQISERPSEDESSTSNESLTAD